MWCRCAPDHPCPQAKSLSCADCPVRCMTKGSFPFVHPHATNRKCHLSVSGQDHLFLNDRNQLFLNSRNHLYLSSRNRTILHRFTRPLFWLRLGLLVVRFEGKILNKIFRFFEQFLNQVWHRGHPQAYTTQYPTSIPTYFWVC